MSWSSGKDSAIALHETMIQGSVEVVGLLTTVEAVSGQVAMHGVRRSLLDLQAESLGLPLHVVELPWPCPNSVYQERMGDALTHARDIGVQAMVFGDLFLEDIRQYREASLESTGIVPLFPLWQRPTPDLARTVIDLGFRALVACVDSTRAPRELVGRWFDRSLLAGFSPGIDPCGENGEFHTVVVDGPGFSSPIDVVVGETREQDGFVFADVIPVARPG
jgi:uncharacterized protein (TIGR00290 family)